MITAGKGAEREAREQVASHVSAGQPGSGSVNGFENAERITTNNLGKPRTVPDVHLTRFAAYFVALNADPPKPEVRTLARLVRHYGPYAPEFSDTAQERARSRPRGGPRRCGRRPEAVREALHPSGEALGSAGDRPGERQGHAGGTAGTRRGIGGETPATRVKPRHNTPDDVKYVTYGCPALTSPAPL